MNIKEFLRKYKIIVILVAIIIVLAFIKNYFGKEVDNSNLVKISPTPTVYSKVIKTQNKPTIISTPSTQSTPSTSSTSENLSEENNSQNKEEVIINDLIIEEQNDKLVAVEGDDPVLISSLSKKLPYEGETFIVKSVFSNSLLLAKSKINDLDKAESDLRDWLSTKGMDFDDLVIAWE